jgi:hypothetical protein
MKKREAFVAPDQIDEEQVLARPSSWSAALSQLPGFASEQAPNLPRPAGKVRAVSSELEEDLDGGDEPPQ